jgi:hypothetical protein
MPPLFSCQFRRIAQNMAARPPALRSSLVLVERATIFGLQWPGGTALRKRRPGRWVVERNIITNGNAE